MAQVALFEMKQESMKKLLIEKLSKDMPDELKTQVASVANLANEIWHEHYTPIIGSVQVEYMLKKFQSEEQIYTDIHENGFTYFIARYQGSENPIAYCGVVPEEDSLLVSKLYVQIDHRGKGISKSLLKKAADLCEKEYGFNKIHLTVNKYNSDSIAIHQKNGFKIIDSIKTDIGNGFFMDDFVMEYLTKSA